MLFQTGYSGRAQMGLCGSDDLSIKLSPDGSAWTEVVRGDRTNGEIAIDQIRIGRDLLANTLPDSGRFNGNGNPTVFSGIAYTAPTYLSAVAGGSFAAHAKFIHNNNDYGGTAGSLDTDVKALVDKIRPLASRRFGAEWYAMLVSNSASTLTGSVTISGTNYGLALSNVTIALPPKFTVGYYVKARTGSTAIAVDLVKRATIDGVSVAAGVGATPVVLTPADGWKYVNLECFPNAYGYDVRILQLLLPLSGQLLLAMPRLVFGHMALDPNRGLLGNARPFG